MRCIPYSPPGRARGHRPGPPAQKRPAPDLGAGGGRRPRRRGFTLVELLAVILIITLLVGILLPTLGRIRLESMVQATRSVIGIIDGAVKSYHLDFGKYPPSEEDPAVYNNFNNNAVRWEGKHLVVLFLTGYGGDKLGPGQFAPTARLDVDDGNEGFGFRTKLRGKVFGPYDGAEKLATIPKPGRQGFGQVPPAFEDSFGGPILYYRFDRRLDPNLNEEVFRYWQQDNLAGPADVDLYARMALPTAQQPNPRYHTMDFLLMSCGADGKYVDPKTDVDSDDITNFLGQ